MTATPVSIDTILVADADSGPRLIPAASAACRSCGLCGVAPGSDTAETAETAVRISLPGRSLAFIAIGLYGVPFAGLLAGALLAALFGAGDEAAAAAATLGCLSAAGVSGRAVRHVEARTLQELHVSACAPTRIDSARSTAELLGAGS